MVYLKIIILSVSVCFSPCYAWRSNSNTSECSAYKSCETCATEPFCQWSLRRQNCETVPRTPDDLTVSGSADCPRYSVANDSAFLAQQNYTYEVTVSNDVHGFVAFLARGPIECYYVEVMLNKTVRFGGRVRGNDTVVCDPVDLRRIASVRVFRRTPLYVFQCVVTFGEPRTALRLDRPAAGFFGVYTSSPDGGGGRCAGAQKRADCMTCAWYDGEYADFVHRCLATNPCVGAFGLFTRVYAGNHTTAETPVSAAPACPADFAVVDVRPTRAPWNGTVNVTVTVKNHRIMDTGGTNVFVSVAGRNCSRPLPAGPDAIRCAVDGPAVATAGTATTAAAAAAASAAAVGPVEVRYVLLRSYSLKSSQLFEWVYPEVTAVRAACDPEAADTVLTIDGALLTSGRGVRVTVGGGGGGSDDGRTCEPVSVADDRIVCRAGRHDEPVRGRVALTFDGGSWTTRVPGRLFDLAAGGPAVDAGQSFETIASGGVTMRVRGARLACAGRPRVYADHRPGGGVRTEADCRVRDDTFMVCRSPRTDVLGPSQPGGPKSAALLPFGFLVDFAGEPLELPQAPGHLTLFPDPEFTGFGTVDGAVVLYGSDLGMGYGLDDVRVLFSRSDDDDVCVVTLMKRDRIVCQSTAEGGVKDLHQVVVAVGIYFSITLRKGGVVDESTVAGRSWFDIVQFSTGMIIVISIVALSLYFAHILGLKNNESYRTDSEPLEEFKNVTIVNTRDIES